MTLTGPRTRHRRLETAVLVLFAATLLIAAVAWLLALIVLILSL